MSASPRTADYTTMLLALLIVFIETLSLVLHLFDMTLLAMVPVHLLVVGAGLWYLLRVRGHVDAIRANRDMLALFAEQNPSPVLRFDRYGGCLFRNQAADQLMHDLPDNRVVVAAAIDACRSMTTQRRQLTAGDTTYMLTFVPVTLADGTKGANIYGMDVTDLQHTVEALRASEVKLAAARDQALEVSQLKTEFLATISHELRTPMNGIIGMSELLIQTGLGSEQHEFAEIVHGEAHHLLHLINDILDFSKLEAGQMVLTAGAFWPAETLAHIQQTFAAKASLKGVTLDVQIAPGVPNQLYGDGARLQQVIAHLTDNAIKFTERGSVSVRMAVDETAPVTGTTLLHVTVQDTGIGLSDVARKRLFGPFAQADGSITRRYGGVGLGLVIARRLVELMGGNITVQSEEGSGATFAFTARFTTGKARLTAPVAGILDEQHTV